MNEEGVKYLESRYKGSFSRIPGRLLYQLFGDVPSSGDWKYGENLLSMERVLVYKERVVYYPSEEIGWDPDMNVYTPLKLETAFNTQIPLYPIKRKVRKQMN